MNPFQNMNPAQIMQQAMQKKAQILQQMPNANPQNLVQQMLNNGSISQQKFEQARNMLGMFGVRL
jgi:hypothetical protein